MRSVPADEWFLSPAERGNRSTVIDVRHRDGLAWTHGNEVEPLIDGHYYFTALCAAVERQQAGDLLLFTDWRGDPDERMGAEEIAVSKLFAAAAKRGVIVKGLFWRSYWDKISYSTQENRSLADDVRAAGGEVLLDMRVRTFGSHHQKFVVLRHPDRPDLDVAFVGGIDLCHTRNDTHEHPGDPQAVRMGKVWGPTPAWHDAQLRVQGPAVGDVEASFRERWYDPTPLVHNPIMVADALIHRDAEHPDPLPDQLPDPPARGTANVQILRTYPYLRPRYPFAPRGERSVARGYDKALARARNLIYLEDQYFWNGEIVSCFVDALTAQPELRLIIVLAHYASQSGRLSVASNLVARVQALNDVYAAGGGRVAVYGLENRAGWPVYVHAKACVVDDVWATIGSDNVNRRSWTHDSELTCAVFDEALDEREPRHPDGFGDGARCFARNLRLELAREHLARPADDDLADLVDPGSAFDAFAESAARLQAWHDGGCRGARPPGHLVPYVAPTFTPAETAAGEVIYRAFCDPDGRPLRMRLQKRF